MPICPKELATLLAEIERLKTENALLRKAAGIKIGAEPRVNQEIEVTAEERNALLKKNN